MGYIMNIMCCSFQIKCKIFTLTMFYGKKNKIKFGPSLGNCSDSISLHSGIIQLHKDISLYFICICIFKSLFEYSDFRTNFISSLFRFVRREQNSRHCCSRLKPCFVCCFFVSLLFWLAFLQQGKYFEVPEVTCESTSRNSACLHVQRMEMEMEMEIGSYLHKEASEQCLWTNHSLY